MNAKFLILALTSLTVLCSGCAAGFRAGGPNTGVDVGAAIGPPATSMAIQGNTVPTLPPPQVP